MLYHWCIINERKKWLKNQSQIKTLYHWGTIHSRWVSPRNQYQIKTLYHWCIIYERRKWLNNRSQRKHGTVEEQYTPGGYVLKTKIKSEIHVVPLMCNLGKKKQKNPLTKKLSMIKAILITNKFWEKILFLSYKKILRQTYRFSSEINT